MKGQRGSGQDVGDCQGVWGPKCLRREAVVNCQPP